jgi:anti-sigma factor RsiW
MRCEDIEPIVEALADGGIGADAARDAHIASCPLCSARLANAQAIHALLVSREAAQPPAGFTAAVMARVVREGWQTERAIDIGFNLAIAAGVLILISGAAGLAWTSGLLTITLDLPEILSLVSQPLTNRIVSNLQTMVMAAALLTMALGLWWWAEADPSL